MSSEPREYLLHIIAETDYLIEHSRSIDRDEFETDETFRRAFVRSLEVIGEATKRLPDDFRSRHPDIEWRAMAGMRDRLIHDYLGVDYDLVWEVVTEKIPDLRAALSRIVETAPADVEGERSQEGGDTEQPCADTD